MGELGSEYGSLKYKQGYDQGKFEGSLIPYEEPQKPVVSQFVADVIEGAREKSPELEDAIHYTWGNGSKEFTEWYKKKSNRDLFARAWLDGYEIEKEKRYIVKVKGVEESHKYLNHRIVAVVCFGLINMRVIQLLWISDKKSLISMGKRST